MAAAMNTKTGALASLSAPNTQSAIAAIAAAMNTKTGALAGLSAYNMHGHAGGFGPSFLNGLLAHANESSQVKRDVPGFREAALVMFGDLASGFHGGG